MHGNLTFTNFLFDVWLNKSLFAISSKRCLSCNPDENMLPNSVRKTEDVRIMSDSDENMLRKYSVKSSRCVYATWYPACIIPHPSFACSILWMIVHWNNVTAGIKASSRVNKYDFISILYSYYRRSICPKIIILHYIKFLYHEFCSFSGSRAVISLGRKLRVYYFPKLKHQAYWEPYFYLVWKLHHWFTSLSI